MKLSGELAWKLEPLLCKYQRYIKFWELYVEPDNFHIILSINWYRVFADIVEFVLLSAGVFWFINEVIKWIRR